MSKSIQFFFIVFLVTGNLIIAQEIPDHTRPSPEATAFRKYGNVDINESTGKTILNMLLYNYNEGQLNIPVSLSYLGSGVKIYAPKKWTRISWALKSGGVITRVLYDSPNELVQERTFQQQKATLYDSNIFNLCESKELIYPDSQVTYYYDLVNGLLTHILLPNFISIYYEYDEFNRLKHVKDEDGNILSENKYHYANQN